MRSHVQSRRDTLKALVSSATLALMASIERPSLADERRATSARQSLDRPRYYVLLGLTGGIDGILTLDPKTRPEIDADVDLPYPREKIVEVGNIALGPNFAWLSKWASNMTVLRGVQLATANHHSGAQQIVRLRTHCASTMPTFFDVVGAFREDQPIGSMILGSFLNQMNTSGYFGGMANFLTGFGQVHDPKDMLDDIDAAAPDDLRRAAKVLRGHAKSLRASGPNGPTRLAVANIEQVAALFERLPNVPRFQFDPSWAQESPARSIAMKLQRTLWAIENDLTCGVAVDLFTGSWDSHSTNDAIQSANSKMLMPLFERFMTALTKRRNSHGALVDSTAVILGSEIGRFPRLNPMKGKDHFADAPYALFGRWFNGGNAYGRTGRMMQGLPVSLRTGRTVAQGGRVPTLDDLGATLLQQAGIDPALYGYFGEQLQFMVKS